ncbi:MAG: ABC transporter permease [bacterium]
MSKTFAIYRKELKTLFVSPLAYVVMGVFLGLTGYFFALILFNTREASMRYVFGNMAIILLLISPLMTMRAFAEEHRTGTDELLMTTPVTLWQIVLGKYFAVLTLFAAMLALSAEFPAILFRFGDPDLGPILGGYAGLLLMGAAFVAVGLFASSLTNNQMVAGIVAFGILLLLWLIEWAAGALGMASTKVFEALSILRHYNDFEKGVVDTVHVYYYFALVFLFLFLSIRSLETRRW